MRLLSQSTARHVLTLRRTQLHLWEIEHTKPFHPPSQPSLLRPLTAAVFLLVEVRSFLHVLVVVVIPGVEISQGFVPSHHIRALHTTLLTGSFPDPKLRAVGPNNLGEMPGTPGALHAAERIPGTANFIIPER